MRKGHNVVTAAILAIALVACGKKKQVDAPKQQVKIAYAVYGVGLFDQIGDSKAAEYLSRGEMVTVTENLDAPVAKEGTKAKVWAKIERTTGKKGFVDAANLESKAFVVIRPLEVFSINQASGKRLATVPAGQVGFVTEERAEWAKVRFGYKVYEQWSFAADSTKYVDGRWAQIEGVSYDPAAIGQGVELEVALRKFNDADAKKKAAGKKELEAIVREGKSQFIDAAQKALGSENTIKTEEAKPAAPASTPTAPVNGGN